MSISTPTAKALRLEDFGDAATPELEQGLVVANQFMADTCNCLAQLAGQSVSLTNRRFTTPAAGNGVLTVANPLPTKVEQVHVTVQRADGTVTLAAYSHTWRNLPSNQLEVQFQGLTASAEYLANLVVR